MFLYVILSVVITFIILFSLFSLSYNQTPISEDDKEEGFKNILIKGDRPCEINLSNEKLKEVQDILKDRIDFWTNHQNRSQKSFQTSYNIYRRYIINRDRLQRNVSLYKQYLGKGESIKRNHDSKIAQYTTQINRYKNAIDIKQTEITTHKNNLSSLRKKVGLLPTFNHGLSWKRVDGYRENAGWLSNNKGIVESGKVMSIKNILFAFKKHSVVLRKKRNEAIHAIYRRYHKIYSTPARFNPVFRRLWRLRRNLEVQRINRNRHYDINNQGISERHTYCVEILGYFRPKTTGNHRFALFSDDFSYLWIGHEGDQELPVSRFSGVGGRMVTPSIHNGGAHPMRKRYSGMLYMVKDRYYPLRIQFGERGGGDNLVFTFIEPGSRGEKTDGRGYFFHAEGHSFAKYDLIKNNYSAMGEMKRVTSLLKSTETSLNQYITVYNTARRNRDMTVNMKRKIEEQSMNAERNIANTESRISHNAKGIQRYSRALRHYKSRTNYYKKRKTSIQQYYNKVLSSSTLPIDHYTLSNINLRTNEETPRINDTEDVLNWPKCYRQVSGNNKNVILAEERRVRKEYTDKLDVKPYSVLEDGENYAQLRFHSQDVLDYIPNKLLTK